MTKVFKVLCCILLVACAGKKNTNIEIAKSEDTDSIRINPAHMLDTQVEEKDKSKSITKFEETEESIQIDTINEFAIKEGNIIKIYTENDTLIFKSEPDLEEQSKAFEYKEFNSNNGFHVVCAQYWESYYCYLVDHKTGNIDSIWQEPVFSPNDSFLVSKSLDYGLEGVPNGFQVWHLADNRDWIKMQEIDQQQWIPVSFHWVSNDSFNVKAVTIQHFEEKDWNYKNLTDFQNIKFGVENE